MHRDDWDELGGATPDPAEATSINGRFKDTPDLITSADLVATDADSRVALWTAPALKLEFPHNWPAVFKESPTLKGLINKKMLNGTRCRAVSLSLAICAVSACSPSNFCSGRMKCKSETRKLAP